MKIKASGKKIKSAAEFVFKAISLYLTSKKMPDAEIVSYHITHNGRYLVINTGIDAPAGEIRCISKSVREDKMFISFYSKSALDKGTKEEYIFPVKLPENCNEIYLYKGKDNYQMSLYKDKDSGKWMRAPIIF